jgi:hypothetical protein
MNEIFHRARGIALAGTGLVGLMLGWSKAGELVSAADDRAVLAGFALYALGGAVLFVLVAAALRRLAGPDRCPSNEISGPIDGAP